MAEEIRGLNVKFDADFSEFKKGMKSAEKDISSTQRQLKTLKDSLKLEWDPAKFQKAQTAAQKALDATEKKASILRKRYADMEKAGITDENREQFRYLAEEIDKTDLKSQQLRATLEDLDKLKMQNLTKGLDNAADKLDNIAQKTKGLSLAAGGALVGLGALGIKSVQTADNVATLATKYDMTSEALQRFNYVALQTDTEAEQLYKAFVKVQGGVADLQTGVSSVATKALSQLGLSFDQFDGKEEQFYAIIDALANMEDQAKMVSVANDIFGERMATNLFPLIYAGTDAIEGYKEEYAELGALSEEQVKSLAEFDNVMNKLKTQFSNVALQIGSSLLPVMESVAEILSTSVLPAVKAFSDWFGSLDSGVQTAMISMLAFLALLSPMAKGLSGVIRLVSSLVPMFSKLDAATLKLYGKWALLGTAVMTLFSVLANWEKMGTAQKIIALLGALSAAALAAAVAFGAFHSAWSMGLAVAGIVAGIATAIAAVKSAEQEIGLDAGFSTDGYESAVESKRYELSSANGSSSSPVNSASNTYVDNSNTTINIEKNEYMTDEDIIKAVNRGLRQARQARA